jgi:hypothetical protein
MAYDKLKVFEQAKIAITENNLFFIEDIIAFVSCSKFYFYDAFPIDSNEYTILKDLLDRNKIRTKSAIRAKLFKGEKAAELLSLYRLVCSPEERQMLNQQYIDHTSKGDKLVIEVIPPNFENQT